MKIGILQTGRSPEDIRAEQGDYDELFRDLLDGQGLNFKTYRVLEEQFPSSPHEAQGWLITGSRHSAYENLPWIAPLEQLIRQIFDADIPLVGICFGHQVIAQALGGRVVKHPQGWAVGPQIYQMQQGKTVSLNAWHQDQVARLPEGACVLGGNAFCKHAILSYEQRALSFQAHPEFTPRFTSELLSARRSVLPEAVASDAERRLVQSPALDNMADAIVSFFKERKVTI